MRPTLAIVLLSLVGVTLTLAGPVTLGMRPSHDNDDDNNIFVDESDNREDSDFDEVPVTAPRSSGRQPADVKDQIRTRRDVPDPEPCGCRRPSNTDPEHDEYLNYKDPYKRERRQLCPNRTVTEERLIKAEVRQGEVREGKVREGKVGEGKVGEGKVGEEEVGEGKVEEGKVKEGKVDKGKVEEGEVDEADVLQTTEPEPVTEMVREPLNEEEVVGDISEEMPEEDGHGHGLAGNVSAEISENAREENSTNDPEEAEEAEEVEKVTQQSTEAGRQKRNVEDMDMDTETDTGANTNTNTIMDTIVDNEVEEFVNSNIVDLTSESAPPDLEGGAPLDSIATTATTTATASQLLLRVVAEEGHDAFDVADEEVNLLTDGSKVSALLAPMVLDEIHAEDKENASAAEATLRIRRSTKVSSESSESQEDEDTLLAPHSFTVVMAETATEKLI